MKIFIFIYKICPSGNTCYIYRDGEIEGTIDLNRYFYKNRSQAMSFIIMEYKSQE